MTLPVAVDLEKAEKQAFWPKMLPNILLHSICRIIEMIAVRSQP